MGDHHHDFCGYCRRGFNHEDYDTLRSMVTTHEASCSDNPSNS